MKMTIEIHPSTPQHMRDWIENLIKKRRWTVEQIKKSNILREYVVEEEGSTIRGDCNPTHLN